MYPLQRSGLVGLQQHLSQKLYPCARFLLFPWLVFPLIASTWFRRFLPESSQSKVLSSSLSLVPIVPSSVPVLVIRPPFVSSNFLLLEKFILDTIGGQTVGHTHSTLDCSRALSHMEYRLSAFKLGTRVDGFVLHEILYGLAGSLHLHWPVLSICTGWFQCGDGTAKNQAIVLAGSITLHWPVSLSLNGTLSIAFIIRKVKIALCLKEFARILHIICHEVYVFTLEWAISSLPNGVDSNPDIYPPPYVDPLLIGDVLFYRIPSVNVTKSVDMRLPYGMLLTRLFEHVRVTHPHAFFDDFYLVDYMMILLSEKSLRIMPNRKGPRLPTLTPSESSNSPSPSSHQEEENDPVNNYTLDSIPYTDQLPPIKRGESSNSCKPKGSPRALVISTPSSSPIEPHPYLTTLDDLPPRNSNPPPPLLSQSLSQTLPLLTTMDFKPSFPQINLSRSRMCAQPEPFLSRVQAMQQLSQYQDFDLHLEAVIQNAQNVQNGLLLPFTTTSPQMPPPIHFTTTSSTSIPPFRTSLPPSSTFVPFDQSLWMERPPFSQ
nr:hypothetical protein [Tanacetum cinerariifolium]